ncbi:MAG TPA: 2-C-methyl-D-erythritol 2,4-cyclodiphosphate synthase [Gemmatimonadales bacterium]|nr:2-C-methyl-D-erythritol 2,4-cyclodiphosphate synthase [Gemmatimonadales bacterium]
MSTRFGFGYDSHTFGAQRPLRLAGVVLDPTAGLTGHSDGDAVAHAVIDALLGATALGDIGGLFPDTDPRWKDADSMALLRTVRERLAEHGFTPSNLDVTVVTEAPRLAPHIEGMRQRLAEALGLGVGAVSVKGKTNEGMDAVGAGRGLVVYAVAAVDGS